MNIYDFDGTIYDGDSSIDFYKYAIHRNKRCLLILPKFFISTILYITKIKNKEYLKSSFYSFVKYIKNIDEIIEDFYKENQHKIKEYYIKQKEPTDIIITAGAEFIIEPFKKALGFKLIGTKVNKKTGKLESKNCHDEEKVKRLKEEGITSCKNFYSDSNSDTPLTKIAEQSYKVKGKEITKWEEVK